MQHASFATPQENMSFMFWPQDSMYTSSLPMIYSSSEQALLLHNQILLAENNHLKALLEELTKVKVNGQHWPNLTVALDEDVSLPRDSSDPPPKKNFRKNRKCMIETCHKHYSSRIALNYHMRKSHPAEYERIKDGPKKTNN